MPVNAIGRWLESQLQVGKIVIGELAAFHEERVIVVSHRDDIARENLRQFSIFDAHLLAKFDDSRKYRPLKAAPTLQHGWKIVANDWDEVFEIIEAIYPGRFAILQKLESGELVTTSLRETLNRQSGMYRVAGKISDQQIDEVVGNFCRSDGGCLRTILWRCDASGALPSRKLPAEKFDPAHDQFVVGGYGDRSTGQIKPRPATPAMPLLCQEACHLLVNECRKVVKGE